MSLQNELKDDIVEILSIENILKELVTKMPLDDIKKYQNMMNSIYEERFFIQKDIEWNRLSEEFELEKIDFLKDLIVGENYLFIYKPTYSETIKIAHSTLIALATVESSDETSDWSRKNHRDLVYNFEVFLKNTLEAYHCYTNKNMEYCPTRLVNIDDDVICYEYYNSHYVIGFNIFHIRKNIMKN